MTPYPFHAECLADIAADLDRTCAGCIAEAARSKTGTETVAGYLLCVAALRRPEPAPEPDPGEAGVLQDWFRARRAMAEGDASEEQARNLDRLTFAALRAARPDAS